MTSNLMETLQTYDPPTAPPTYMNQYPGQSYAAPPPPVAPPPQEPLQSPDPDLALTNAPEYQRRLDAYIAAREERLVDRLSSRLEGYMQPVNQTMGTIARSQIANDPKFSDVFKRYGHEIDQEFIRNGIATAARTPEAYRMVAEMVQGRHWRELAHEEAARLAAGQAPGTVRSSPDGQTFASTPQGDALDQIWDTDAEYFKNARLQGLTKSDVREAAQRQGLPIDKWVKMVTSADVFVAPDGKHVQMRRVMTGEKNA